MIQNDLIDELLKEQELVILGLDELNARIELYLKSLAPPPNTELKAEPESHPIPKRKAA